MSDKTDSKPDNTTLNTENNSNSTEEKFKNPENNNSPNNIDSGIGDLEGSASNTFQGDSNNVNTTINNTKTENLFFGETEKIIKIRFSQKNHCRITKEEDLGSFEEKIELWLDQSLSDSIFNNIAGNRILILTSKQEYNHYLHDIALLIGYVLKQHESKVNNIYQVESLSDNLIIDLKEDILNKKEFEKNLVVFNNALRKDNKYILNFFEELDSASNLYGLVNSMYHTTNTHTIFVVQKDKISQYNNLLKSDIVIEVIPPNEDLLRKFINSKIAGLASLDLSETQKQYLNENKEDISSLIENSISTPSKAEELFNQIQYWLSHDKNWIPETERLNELIRSIRDFKGWFMGDLAKDKKAWNFVFSLGLLYSFPKNTTSQISLMEFVFFRKYLEEFYRKPRKYSEKQEKIDEIILDEEILFQKCRVEKYEEEGFYYMRFINENYLDEIWEVFFQNLSLRLVELLPFLSGTELPRTYARIIGKIGELNPWYINNWIEGKANSSEIEERDLVGYLYQGIFSSKSKSYISLCRKKLSEIGTSDNFYKVLTAISALRFIGGYNLEYAMKELLIIINRYATEHYKQWKKHKSKLDWIKNSVVKNEYELYVELEKFFNTKEELLRVKEKFEKNREVFKITRYSLAALCFQVNPIDVFNEWKKWFNESDRDIKTITMLMIASSNGQGVLNHIDRSFSYYNNELNEWQDWHYIVRVLHDVEEQQHDEFIEFFAVLFNNLKILPPADRLDTKNSILDVLLSWGTYSAENDKAKQIIISFYVKLMKKVPEIEKGLMKRITSWEKPSQKNEKLRQLSSDISNAIASNRKAVTSESQVLNRLFS